MKCVAGRDYKVIRFHGKFIGGDIRTLQCAYCSFAVFKRLTPKPRTSKSGLGRYNRMRAQMVAHLHKAHRAELEKALEAE